MKKILFLLSFLFAAVVVNAQSQGQFRINAGLALGTEAGFNGAGLGVNVGAEYLFTDAISASPSFTYFFKSTESVTIFNTQTNQFESYDTSVQFTSFNIDGRYYFLTGDLQVYGIAGIAILSSTFKQPFYNNNFLVTQIKTTTSDTGLNLGAGLVYMLSDGIGVNGQLKYQSQTDQIVLNGGVAFILN